MNRDSNAYTFIFAIIMVVVVASALAFTAVSLKPMQDDNIRKEKMQNILATIGIKVERPEAEAAFNQYFKKENQLSLTKDGDVDESVDAFNINLTSEIKKPVDEQRFPLFIAEKEGSEYYVIPLRGAGLWDAIWGYVALDDDMNTIKGVVFDHKGETPGLGAEITQTYFQERFSDKKIEDENGNFVGITVMKGGSQGNDNAIDAISGATITSRGVENMIKERLEHYLNYFKKEQSKVALN
ncbi:Na+-transporting NADH:ubiquinone oxidoreductase subunit C [Pustulibacterium marinum]|uniref:Na(+)-translocating NADH-quinone reductase subunit C n=1 Tax=Pustulibacterium marinum TaxID=1224947 RepID=A0A1I7G799_9FLAO|nr:NADH:ubiquinone reductase (Na(+)-transporting) subunit C [Pustulibacterium marinum]SFU44116.1 Na+-transporting NADH:ubiquinone oxidoreductase subunit C [Pustulibacterium marinum]